MKKVRLLFIAIIATLLVFDMTSLYAQARFEITPYIGYQFSGSVPYTTGKFDIKDSEDYGLAVDIPMPFRDGVELELLYLRMDTQLKYDEYSYGVITNSETFDIIVEYYQIGGMNVMEIPGSNVKPFGGLTIGASRFNPNGTTRGDEWFFSATLGAGVKIIPSEKIGIRLQGRLLLPFQWGSGGLWCGTGSGCSVGVGATSVFIQGDFTAGLIIRL
jgi:opacity protein-like surface antigen